MGDEGQLGCFPKSSGPPGRPPENLQAYIRRRVTAEVTAAIDERSRREEQSSVNYFPPFPPGARFGKRADRRCHAFWGPVQEARTGQTASMVLPPPQALLTLSAGSSSLMIHDRELANSLVRQGKENFFLARQTDLRCRERRGRSPSPVLRRVHRRQPVEREALEDTHGEYAASTVVRAPRTPGDFLPQPSRDWHRLTLDDGEWDFRFQYLGAPAMRTSDTDVAHVVWNTMFCCQTVAGIVLEDFHSAQNAASHHKWAEMQRLLKFFRGAVMSDAYRLQAAVELEVVTLPVGSSSAQQRWMAAILSTADNAPQRRWSEDSVSDAVHTRNSSASAPSGTFTRSQ